ncbi:MAG: hypothetical protein AB7N65_28555 [Vicinamibacterales bacterium]
MADFTVRADSVNVEEIMDQIRARIREKRGVDYTEQQIREMATAKLEKFLDPRGVRSDLLERFRSAQPVYTPPELPNYAFEEQTLFESHRGPLRSIRRWLRPILKLFFNPGPLIQALNIQSRLNTLNAEREARREASRHAMDQLYYEVMHNLVVETTRMAIEVKNLKMKVESLTSRLEFNERRARALESVVVYKPLETSSGGDVPPSAETLPTPAGSPEAPPAAGAGAAGVAAEGPGQRSRRRRRRRGRRGGGSAAALMGSGGDEQAIADESGDDEPDSGQADGVDVDAAVGEEAIGATDREASSPASESGPPATSGTPDAEPQ